MAWATHLIGKLGLTLALVCGVLSGTAVAKGMLELRIKGATTKLPAIDVSPNRFRGNYPEITVKGGRWLFRRNLFPKDRRTQRELAYFHTSEALGLDAVPELVGGAWQGEKGSLQRVVRDARRSDGSVKHDIAEVKAKGVDWDSLHAVAIQHFVTGMFDDKPYNILISKSVGGKLRYDAIDGERSLGYAERFERSGTAAKMVQGSHALGGPKQLSASLWAKIKATKTAAWTKQLKALGITNKEVTAALQRLGRVQTRGLDALF